VVTFDFVGHGLSSGKITEVNLENRQAQALAVIGAYKLTPHLTVIGFSMSGQTAIDLLQDNLTGVASLILLVPAVYDKSARNAYFGVDSEFTKRIRKPASWRRSDAWQKITQFEGRVLVFEAANDIVIPRAIPKKLHDSTQNAAKRLHARVLDSPQQHGTLDGTKAKPGRVVCQNHS
jgi:pimeloyl-ACP methyl ester carboxylesterase